MCLNNLPRKGPWKVIVETITGKIYNYHFDTERDADVFSIAVTAHSRDIASTEVLPS